MNISALIPARISSKRLPKKNIKKLNGKPLLFWSIDVALEANCFDTVCVSTESQEIAELVYKNYPGNKVSVLIRPIELSTDSSDLKDVCCHFLDQFPEIDFLCLMMPTYPFRNAEKIKNHILPALYSRQLDRVNSVLPESFSTFDYWIKSGNDYIKMFKNQPLWCEAGTAAYSFMKREYFYKEAHHWTYNIGERELKIVTDFNESIDIDTEEDFKKAEKIAKGFKYNYLAIKVVVLGENEFIVPKGLDILKFKEYLISKGCNLSEPILILKSPPPYFTFLRWYERAAQKDYKEQITNEIIANLPTSGHSQDFPEHFIHSSHYRVLRKNKDCLGIIEKSVPEKQVVLYSDLKKWFGFVDPHFWEKI